MEKARLVYNSVPWCSLKKNLQNCKLITGWFCVFGKFNNYEWSDKLRVESENRRDRSASKLKLKSKMVFAASLEERSSLWSSEGGGESRWKKSYHHIIHIIHIHIILSISILSISISISSILLNESRWNKSYHPPYPFLSSISCWKSIQGGPKMAIPHPHPHPHL